MEQTSHKEISPLVRKTFLRLLPVQIIEIIVFAVNSFVDSLITSRFLGTPAMAAIGLFAPIATVIGISDVLIFGTQILCGRYIGSGEGKKVVSLFSTGVVFLSAFSIVLSLVCLAFRQPLAGLLGAKGDLVPLLTDYITGYAPGIIGQVLTGMLMVFLPYNNDIRRCYLGIGIMIVSNTILDLLFVIVWKTGILGMGIATSASYLISFAVMLPGFVSEKKAVYLQFRGLCFSRLPEAARFGLPSLMLVIGCTARGYIMNLSLMTSVGVAAVAAMTVQNMVCAVIGAIPMGCANAFLTMGSIYYGEENRHSLLDLLHFSLRFGAMLSAAVTALLMLCSGAIASLFYAPAEEAWSVTRRMLLLFPVFLVLNTAFTLLLKSYQLQKKDGMVNAMSVIEPLLMGAFTAALVGVIGSDAAWLAFPVSELVCLLILSASVMLHAGKLTFALADWMKLSPDFGASPEECMEISVLSEEQVLNLSVQVIDFCRKRKIDERRSMLAGLAVEEMAGNVVKYGFRPGKKCHVEIRLVAKGRLTVCIRDDCPAFDPKSRLDQFTPEDVTANIGIRMIAALSGEMNYQCTAGINTLMLRI